MPARYPTEAIAAAAQSVLVLDDVSQGRGSEALERNWDVFRFDARGIRQRTPVPVVGFIEEARSMLWEYHRQRDSARLAELGPPPEPADIGFEASDCGTLQAAKAGVRAWELAEARRVAGSVEEACDELWDAVEAVGGWDPDPLAVAEAARFCSRHDGKTCISRALARIERNEAALDARLVADGAVDPSGTRPALNGWRIARVTFTGYLDDRRSVKEGGLPWAVAELETRLPPVAVGEPARTFAILGVLDGLSERADCTAGILDRLGDSPTFVSLALASTAEDPRALAHLVDAALAPASPSTAPLADWAAELLAVRDRPFVPVLVARAAARGPRALERAGEVVRRCGTSPAVLAQWQDHPDPLVRDWARSETRQARQVDPWTSFCSSSR